MGLKHHPKVVQDFASPILKKAGEVDTGGRHLVGPWLWLKYGLYAHIKHDDLLMDFFFSTTPCLCFLLFLKSHQSAFMLWNVIIPIEEL